MTNRNVNRCDIKIIMNFIMDERDNIKEKRH